LSENPLQLSKLFRGAQDVKSVVSKAVLKEAVSFPLLE